MNVIKELWHGNIIPGEDSRTNLREMKAFLDTRHGAKIQNCRIVKEN